MAIIVQSIYTRAYLNSPLEVGTHKGKPEFVWLWSCNEQEAHHFKDRAEAKETLRSILSENLVGIKEYKFFKI